MVERFCIRLLLPFRTCAAASVRERPFISISGFVISVLFIKIAKQRSSRVLTALVNRNITLNASASPFLSAMFTLHYQHCAERFCVTSFERNDTGNIPLVHLTPAPRNTMNMQMPCELGQHYYYDCEMCILRADDKFFSMQMHAKMYYNFSSDKQILLWIVLQMWEDKAVSSQSFHLWRAVWKSSAKDGNDGVCFIVRWFCSSALQYFIRFNGAINGFGSVCVCRRGRRRWCNKACKSNRHSNNTFAFLYLLRLRRV